ncbi:calcium/calmodulin-dependent protein kinase kinase [Cordyceps militaris CM01]|uniref:Calcium/calmodulin-dependent protein kinase kinase n=1 Tax=Cordyceps militaris (strain CM01) TaxID=983644 RepID=G3JB76_CORMM|nr:calcium/calmodulin-dependent protein kinase kinase [Cordyceps militaris CM01]EGX94436.1 calcium/calmodulin-dependent protein kinase kinase [Cordyceps militaris CM01]
MDSSSSMETPTAPTINMPQNEPSLPLKYDSVQDLSTSAMLERPQLATNASDPPGLQNFQSPLRQHKRQPSAHREIKETLDARVEYASDEDDGRTYHKINQYTIIEEVGRGSYGAVHLATDQFGTEYAVKEFSKSRLRKRAQSQILRRGPQGRPRRQPLRVRSNGQVLTPQLGGEQPGEKEDSLHLIREEVAIMKKLNHPNLVQLIEVLDDPGEDSLYMVLEMCKKGVAMKVGLDDQADPYSDDVCRYYFRDLILAIEYLHSQSIIHRDIKPDNLLVAADDTLKVSDFGVSEMFEKPDHMKIKKSAGSPAFLAPELCSPHGEVSGTAADIWSMGVCLYCFRYGKIPFNRVSVLEMYEAIQTEQPKIPDGEDPAFVDILERLLKKDPEQRITMAELREHQWITKDGTDTLLSEEENCAHKVDPPNELEISRAFTRKMDNVFCVLKAISKFKSLLSDRRASRSPVVTDEIGDGTFDPAEEKARAEEIEALLAQRREVLSRRTRDSTGDSDDSTAGKGHAKDISDQEPLYLGIGTSSRHAFYLDDESADDVVADSPSAVDYNIYDRAYEQAIKDRLSANPAARPVMYLTKFVRETDHFKSFENIVEGTIFSPAAVREQMRETRASLHEHFTSPSTNKLGRLVAKMGLTDPPLADGAVSALVAPNDDADDAEPPPAASADDAAHPALEKLVESDAADKASTASESAAAATGSS